ncbi:MULTISPECIES: hypothetical protein [unclassified Roseobacter]|uniref:hypothetical protein n=1 Tax=unclassified Roseobacter TaxID=196798 RepID=UPI001D5E7DA7|nr:hypothetical protein [Rhodobacterales bacterium HKCCD6035]
MEIQNMRNLSKWTALFLACSTSPLLADGHAGLWNMVGLANTPSTMAMIEGTTGSIMMASSTDLWDWSAAPEGFPSLVTAECTQSVALTTNGQPVGGVGVCSMMDPDGDLAIYFGEITPNMEYIGSLTAGSGKYEPYVGQKFIGTVTGMLSTGQQMYHVVPAD